MQASNPFEQLFKTISTALPEPLKNVQAEIEQNMQQALETMLHKMNVVTREEFDIQAAVLQRTREKITAMEQRLTQLEEQLLPSSTVNTTTEMQQNQLQNQDHSPVK